MLFVTHDGEIEILDHARALRGRFASVSCAARGRQTKKAAVTEGFARVKKAGEVDLFVDAAEWAEEIDRERAEKALGRATERLSSETLAGASSLRRSPPRARTTVAIAASAPAAETMADTRT